MAPRNIAEIIVSHIEPDAHPVIREIDIAGAGFINIHLSDNYLYDTLQTITEMQSAYGTCEKGAGKPVQIEFVSANPTGPLNIVSGRAAAVGDTLVNLLNAIGYKAIREFYVNDAGGQVQRLGESIDVRYRQALGEDGLEIPEGRVSRGIPTRIRTNAHRNRPGHASSTEYRRTGRTFPRQRDRTHLSTTKSIVRTFQGRF